MSGFLENEGIKAVCFDIDGTFYPLFQTRLRVALASLSSLPFAISYNKARQRVRTEDSFLSLPPLSEKERAERMCRYMWDRSDEESISYFIGKEKKVFFDRYERLFSGIKPYEGVVETIEELKKRGYRLGVLSDFPVGTKLNGPEARFPVETEKTFLCPPNVICFDSLTACLADEKFRCVCVCVCVCVCM